MGNNKITIGKLKNNWFYLIPVIILIIVSVLYIYACMPWSDEAWVADASTNLVKYGVLANTNSLDQNVFDIQLDNLILDQPPLYFLSQAAVFDIFGISLFKIRFLSLFFGVVGLCALYYLLRKITDNKIIIFISLLLISINPYYVQSTSIARSDIMASALSLVAFALYINLREKNFILAILLSNVFVCLSGLTHPVGIAGLVALFFLAIYLDRKRINFKIILLGLSPYIIGGILWFIYIFPDFNLFFAKFGGHVTGAGEGSGEGNIIVREFVYRYFLNSYGVLPDSYNIFSVSKLILKLSVIGFYFFNLIVGIFVFKEKRQKTIWWMLIIYFLTLTLIFTNKTASYLVWITPFLIKICFILFPQI